jgi:hypothetical protein
LKEFFINEEVFGMPYTFSHPAASIPFTRCGLTLSALIVGSMAPDFPYFLPGFHNQQVGHTFTGLFLFCLPAGIAALWLFHNILKYPLFSLLPSSHQQRIFPFIHTFTFRSGKHVVLILVSLLVGAMTHIVWDSCTHWYGWTVQHVPFLRLTILETSQGTLRLYKILQHGGTVVGTLLLVYWYRTWLKYAPITQISPEFQLPNKMKMFTLLSMGFLACIAGLAYGVYNVPVGDDITFFSYFVVFTGRASTAIVFLELLVFSIGWHVIQSKKMPKNKGVNMN